MKTKNTFVSIEEFLKNKGELKPNREIYNGNGEFIGFYYGYNSENNTHVCKKHISTLLNISENLHFIKID
jgi:hypothetical protein